VRLLDDDRAAHSVRLELVERFSDGGCVRHLGRISHRATNDVFALELRTVAVVKLYQEVRTEGRLFTGTRGKTLFVLSEPLFKGGGIIASNRNPTIFGMEAGPIQRRGGVNLAKSSAEPDEMVGDAGGGDGAKPECAKKD